MRKVLLTSLIVLGIVIVAAVAWLMTAGADRTEATATRQVVDATGTSVEIPLHPRRVVFLRCIQSLAYTMLPAEGIR